MTDASERPVVIVESPYAGDIAANKEYAKRCCTDCLRRGEIPFASHLFFPEFLNEHVQAERELGLTAGYAFWPLASKIVFYVDRGMSGGMKRAFERATSRYLSWEERYLDKEQK